MAGNAVTVRSYIRAIPPTIGPDDTQSYIRYLEAELMKLEQTNADLLKAVKQMQAMLGIL